MKPQQGGQQLVVNDKYLEEFRELQVNNFVFRLYWYVMIHQLISKSYSFSQLVNIMENIPASELLV